MKIYKNIVPVLAMSALFSVSCSDDDDGGDVIDINEPSTYAFTRNGETTVSFSGQTTRIAMAEEIISALKNETLLETQIDAMFAHEENADDFADAVLNASDKSVRSKTAASRDYFSDNATDAAAIKSNFDTWINQQVTVVFPEWGNDAAAGVPGVIQEAGGGSDRWVNGEGLELNQAFGKGLIGALMVDQALNNYLGTSVLEEGSNIEDNDAGTVAEGKNYTTMEHKWDEAYGYLYGASANAASPNATIGDDDSFLNKYIGRVEGDEDFKGIAATIYNAFKKGRAAIVAGEYAIRDEQAAIIREEVSKVIGVRAVYYLQQGKNGLEAGTVDRAAVFHDLSEGYGFIYSLQFTRKPSGDAPYFTRSEVQGLLNQLMEADNGLWNVTPETLQTLSETIASEFDFTVTQAGS